MSVKEKEQLLKQLEMVWAKKSKTHAIYRRVDVKTGEIAYVAKYKNAFPNRQAPMALPETKKHTTIRRTKRKINVSSIKKRNVYLVSSRQRNIRVIPTKAI